MLSCDVFLSDATEFEWCIFRKKGNNNQLFSWGYILAWPVVSADAEGVSATKK